MTTYGEYYQIQSALQDLMPSKRDISSDKVPELIRIKAAEFRLVILGALAELSEEGWEDDE